MVVLKCFLQDSPCQHTQSIYNIYKTGRKTDILKEGNNNTTDLL